MENPQTTALGTATSDIEGDYEFRLFREIKDRVETICDCSGETADSTVPLVAADYVWLLLLCLVFPGCALVAGLLLI